MALAKKYAFWLKPSYCKLSNPLVKTRGYSLPIFAELLAKISPYVEMTNNAFTIKNFNNLPALIWFKKIIAIFGNPYFLKTTYQMIKTFPF